MKKSINNIVYFLSVGYLVFWLFILYNSFYFISFKVFIFEWAVLPLYIMGFSLFLISRYNIKTIRSASIFSLLVLHSIFALLYLMFIVFYFPPLLEKETLKQRIDSTKNKIMRYASVAQNIKDVDEVYQYSQIYKLYFPKSENIFLSSEEEIQKDLFLGDNSNMKKDIKSVADMINVVNTKNLTKEELLQIVREYVYKEYFYAAQLFLSQYVLLYGNSEKTKKLGVDIKTKIGSNIASYDLERKSYFQRKIKYIYNLLLLDKTRYNELLSAYYQITALGNIYPQNSQLQWLLNLWKKRTKNTILFAGEVRLALSKQANIKPIILEERQQGGVRRLWIAKDAVYVDGAAYFSELQLLSFDKKENFISHIESPYAKLSNGKIILQTVERKAVQIKYKPKIIRGDKKNIREISTTVEPKEISYLYSNYRMLLSENIITVIQSIPVWRKYSLPIRILYNRIVYDIMRILFFAIVGYLIVYMQLVLLRQELPSYVMYICASVLASSGLILRGSTRYAMLVYDLSFLPFVPSLVVLGIMLIIVLASIVGLIEHTIKGK